MSSLNDTFRAIGAEICFAAAFARDMCAGAELAPAGAGTGVLRVERNTSDPTTAKLTPKAPAAFVKCLIVWEGIVASSKGRTG